MALSFPLVLSEFADTLRIAEVQFQRLDFVETSGTARGEVLTAEVAAPKWTARITLAAMTPAQAAEAQALIEAIGPHGQFYLYDPRKKNPAKDPTGSILGSTVPTIHTVGGNNRSLRLTGLPAGYIISRGDLMSYTFGSDPLRNAMVRAAETVTASGVGLTPLFEVSGPLKVGTVVGRPVRLRRPQARMQLMPGTFDPGTDGLVVRSGMTFTAIEAY